MPAEDRSIAHFAARSITRRGLFRDAVAVGTAMSLGAAFTDAAIAQSDPTTLTIGLDGTPSDLDPHTANDYRSEIVIRGIYENLIGLKDAAVDQYEGVIAETWEPNADKSIWTFHLRDGISFQDGSVCDAEAVRASFERMLGLGYGPSLELGRFIQSPDQVTAPDPKTVVFTLGRPQPLFETAMTSQYGAQIVNANAAKAQETDGDYGHGWAQVNTEGMGTGPYKVTDFQPSTQAILERNESYWRGWSGDHFERIVVRVVPEAESRRQLIERGEVDIIDRATPETLQALEANPDVQIDRSYSTETDYLILTVAGPLKSIAARQALCYAFPYDDVIAGVYNGYGKRLVGPVADVCYGHNPDTFSYPTDLVKAKELLTQASVSEGATLTVMQTQGEEQNKSMLQLFQANLDQIGIKLDIQTVDQSILIDTLYRDATADEQPNLLPQFWWPIYNDAYDHLQLQVLTAAQGSAGTNSGYYSNAEVDQLMQTAADTTDPTTYLDAISKVQQIVTFNDPAAIYYLQRQWTTVMRKSVQNFVFNPINIGTYNFWKLSRAAPA